MTRDDIIRMAREAGFEINKGQYHGMDADSYLYIWCDGGYLDEELERFAALVSAAEREACAKICESLATDRGMFHPDDEELKIGVLAGAGMCGATIRARGAQ